MALEEEVKAFAVECKIDPKVEGLIGEGILDCEGVATLAAREELRDAKFIQVMITKGVDSMTGSGKQIAVTKFWRRCRTAFDEKKKRKRTRRKFRTPRTKRPRRLTRRRS